MSKEETIEKVDETENEDQDTPTSLVKSQKSKVLYQNVFDAPYECEKCKHEGFSKVEVIREKTIITPAVKADIVIEDTIRKAKNLMDYGEEENDKKKPEEKKEEKPMTGTPDTEDAPIDTSTPSEIDNAMAKINDE